MRLTRSAARALQRAATVSVALALAACASYTPPAALDTIDNVRTIDASYDETWTALINHVSGSFFGIKNFEKASGLLTLSFGATDAPRFVECGTWGGTWGSGQRYIERGDLNFVLDGQMNVFVQSLAPRKTQVRVTTHYILRDNSRDVYDFTSNTSATVYVRNPARGTMPTRTCRSTHTAEKQILNAISAIASR